MLRFKDVKKYIEKKNNVELTEMQGRILKAIIRGETIYTARGIGRSFLYNGYADYLKEVIAKDTDRTIAPEDYDDVFTASMMVDDKVFNDKMVGIWSSIKSKNPESYAIEYECNYVNKK